jgi:hypothetical protein
MPSWIEAAEAALSGTATETEPEVLRPEPPPVLDAVGLRALLAPFLAAFMWAASIFREVQIATPLDPLALLLRLLALALTVRALTLLFLLAQRLRLRFSYTRHALVLTAEGMLYRSPKMDVALPREDILDVRERGRWRDRGGRRFADVYVVTQPGTGRTHLALPPVFERTPGVLAERLMRWLGPPDEADAAESPPRESQPPASEPQPLLSELWERVARGERPSGVSAIPHGSAWLQRGPYASVLLGVAVVEGFFRLPEQARADVGSTMPLVLLGILVIVPISWYLLTRRQLASRLGLALVLTPSELLFRTRSGVVRVEWSRLVRAEIESRATWSLLLGAHEFRSLALQRKNAPEIRYHDSFLGAPLEVVTSLCDAYRKGRIKS